MDKTKIILFGYGGLAKKAISFTRKKHKFFFTLIVGSKKWGQTDCGIKICGIEQLNKVDFDFIIILSMFHREISEGLYKKRI